MKAEFENKKILLTGGAGSVGQLVITEILKFHPQVLRVLDIDETREAEVKNKLNNNSSIRFLLGDVRDKDRLKRAVEDIDIIFHFASLKHVSACEYNPMEAVKTNVLGTQNIIEVALEEEVEKVVFTSSDKAVNPCNVLGATKQLGEKLITAANYYKGKRKTVFCSTRFGNVIGSRGSILPLFKEQVKNGEPVTLTDKTMTRFIMSVADACSLLFSATKLAKGGEIFVPKMYVVRIIDLAKAVINELEGSDKDKIKIRVVGRLPGEKLFEELMTDDEALRSVETKDLFIIKPELSEYLNGNLLQYPNSQPIKMPHYRSDDAEPLSVKQIYDLLHQQNLL